MSDWRAAHSTTAVLKGLDQEMPDSTYLGASLVEAVDAGTIPEAAVDLSATRILTPLFQVFRCLNVTPKRSCMLPRLLFQPHSRGVSICSERLVSLMLTTTTQSILTCLALKA